MSRPLASMTRFVSILLPLVLLLTSCSLALRAAVRNDTDNDITVVVGGRHFEVTRGAMSNSFALPGWVLEPRAEYIWKLSVISGSCLYRYPVPALKRPPGGGFPQDPLIVAVQPDFTLKFEYPETWKQREIEVVQLAGKPLSDCNDPT